VIGLSPRAAIAAGRLWATASYAAGADPRRLARRRLGRLFWRLQSGHTRRLFVRGFLWQWRLIEAALAVRDRRETA